MLSRRDGAERQVQALLDLMERIKDGDETAMELFYEQTSPLLYGFAMRIVGNPQDAEEVLLDVYTKVWRMADRFDANYGGVKRWLILITRSRAIDHVRKRNLWRRQHEPFETVDGLLASASLAPSQDIAMVAQERSGQLETALESLPQTQRAVIELSFFSELSHTEISRELGVPLGTIKTRIRLGLSRLQRILRKQRPIAEQQ